MLGDQVRADAALPLFLSAPVQLPGRASWRRRPAACCAASVSRARCPRASRPHRPTLSWWRSSTAAGPTLCRPETAGQRRRLHQGFAAGSLLHRQSRSILRTPLPV